MKNQDLLDLYSDYLISSFGPTTGTGLAALLGGAVSHDRIQRFLAQPALTSADLWQFVKPHVRARAAADSYLIVDDSIAEKPYTDENDIICWHYDHSQDRIVKGLNFLSALYHVPPGDPPEVSLPVGFALVAKTEQYVDKKDGKTKRRSPITKNEHYQTLLRQAAANQIPFRFVLNDIWYASADNMRLVKQELAREFIMPVKSNRKVALTAAAKQAGRYLRVDCISLEEGVGQVVYLEGLEFPVQLLKHVFTNEDGSCVPQYLVCSDLACSGEQITTVYRKRWNVEVYHKSLKQNAGLENSPTYTVTTQTNHMFAALYGYIKRELVKGVTRRNHFALKSSLYLRALQTAFETVRQLQPIYLTA
jgi:hypothetical protein